MALPTGQEGIWDVTRRVNASYTGDCIQVRNRAGTTSEIGFNQSGASPAVDDKTDISALETFANGDGAWVTIMYDHSGNGHDMLLSNPVGDTNPGIKYRVCDNSGNALVDEFGNLVMRRDASDTDPDIDPVSLFFETNDTLGGITTNTMFGVWSINNTTGAIFGSSNAARPYIGKYDSGGTDGRIDRDAGATEFQLNWFRNGTQFASLGGTNIQTGGLYTEFNKGRGYYSITGGVFNQSPDATPLNNAQLFQGDFESWGGDFQSFMIYPTDISASRTDVEDYYNTELFSASQNPSGTITLSGVAQANAVVDIISCPTVSEGTKTIVEQVTANGSGVYTATVARNTALNYWAEPRHYVEEFTGTLTPVSGTTFSTGVDLSGVSIGGANDPLYVLKSTGGTASGNEVVVESRSGNDITLSYDPGFDGTTTFSLGKAYGANTVLARSTVS